MSNAKQVQIRRERDTYKKELIVMQQDSSNLKRNTKENRKDINKLLQEVMVLRKQNQALQTALLQIEQTSQNSGEVNVTNQVYKELHSETKQELQELKKELLELRTLNERVRDQLPHLVLSVMKLSSLDSMKKLDKRLFSSDEIVVQEFIANEFQVTLLQAKKILQLFKEYR